MSAHIKKFFLNTLNTALESDISNQILDLKIEEQNDSVKIVSIIETSAVPHIRKFASQIDHHQNKMAAALNKKKVSIIFSAKSANLSTEKRKEKRMPLCEVPRVKNVLLVMSGKGGVGKSTLASLISLYLAKNGMKVGLLDADIYGPSIPRIFDINSRPEVESGKIFPHSKYGIELMSAGFLIDKDTAAIWRGPMANKALHQMLLGTKWGEKEALDYLIIDTPPGTGDIHISILEKYKIEGAIIVTTPNKLAIDDVIKSMNLLQITHTEIVSIVSNMDHLILDGNKVKLFDEISDEIFHKFTKVPLIRLPMIRTIASNSTAEVMLQELKEIDLHLKNICKNFK